MKKRINVVFQARAEEKPKGFWSKLFAGEDEHVPLVEKKKKKYKERLEIDRHHFQQRKDTFLVGETKVVMTGSHKNGNNASFSWERMIA